jgi:hypothetical protein
MRTTPRSDSEARLASSRTLVKAGWHPARITEAVEKPSRRGNEMIELTVVVRDAGGNERELRDWLTDSDMGAEKLRNCCKAVGVIDRYEVGEISQEDFPGHDVEVKLGIEKKRGFPDRNVIEDYRAADSSVVHHLRPASSAP